MTTPLASTASTYVHGTAPAEQARLALMNDLINQAMLGELGLRGGERVLDLGAGLGQFSRAMARAVGAGGRVLAVERDASQRARAMALAAEAGEAALVEFRAGDAEAPPLLADEVAAFDLVHARFLLEHVRDPAAVVAAMVRAARPGGRIVLADDDHDLMRTWPEVPAFQHVWRAYTRVYDRNGCDPFVGRRLVALLHAAGAIPVRTTLVFYGACQGMPAFAGTIANLVGVLQSAREAMLAGALTDAETFAHAVEELRAFAVRPDAALWYAIAWAEGRRPSADDSRPAAR